MSVFKMDDFIGTEWMHITHVPNIVDYTLSCSGQQLSFIPLKNATILGEHLYCYVNSLFCLDFCPLIMGLTVYHETITTPRFLNR